MTDVAELFWQASLQDIKRGFTCQNGGAEFVCLICGKSFENGVVYPSGNRLYEARKYIEVHIAECHGSSFEFLLNLDKKLTGLTEHQKTILRHFYEDHSDNDVAKELGAGSTSTIRNHRFALREKQKQAKIFLAIMELLGERIPSKQSFIEIPRSSNYVDERFAITEQENDKIIAAYFKQGPEGPLEVYPLKEKKRVAILRNLLKFFDANRTYTEKEVNSILKPFYEDYVLLRRHLIEYGFMDRVQDGSSYWVKV